MRDLRYEHWLTANGVGFEYVEKVAIADIVIERLAGSQIRMQLDGNTSARVVTEPAIVERYALAMIDGVKFPALLLVRRLGSPTKYAIINGLHRRDAYIAAEITHCDAYVLDVPEDDVTVVRLRRTANFVEGKQYTAAEALAQALQLVAEGMTATDAAKLTLQKFHVVNRALVIERTRTLLVGGGMSAHQTERLSDNTVNRISIIKNPTIAADVARLHLNARLSADQLTELTGQVRDTIAKAGPEKAALVIQRWSKDNRVKERVAETSSGSTRGMRSTKYRAISAKIEAVLRVLATDNLATLNERERKDTRRLLGRLGVALVSATRTLRLPAPPPPRQPSQRALHASA